MNGFRWQEVHWPADSVAADHMGAGDLVSFPLLPSSSRSARVGQRWDAAVRWTSDQDQAQLVRGPAEKQTEEWSLKMGMPSSIMPYQWGFTSLKVAALVPDVAYCALIGEKAFSTSQSNLAFLWDNCCPQTMCLHLMEPHCMHLQSSEENRGLISPESCPPNFQRCGIAQEGVVRLVFLVLQQICHI